MGTVGIICAGGSMKLSGVRPSVRLSVRPIIRPPHVAAAYLLQWPVGLADSRNRSIAARPAVSSSRVAARRAATRKLRAVPRCQLT